MAVELNNARGTRDILPEEFRARQVILNVIRETFEQFGFVGIETPALEKTATLLGKYGEESDRLIFKILPRGEKLEKWLNEENPLAKQSEYVEEALRYDLTVPFARMVVQHRNEIYLPFKRYQIQPVWRADRPQKGRFREFYQCDADVIGSTSLLNEAELLLIYARVFERLGLKVKIKINHRKLLRGLAEKMNCENRFQELTVALDKLDKIGKDGVLKELKLMGFDEQQTGVLNQLLSAGTGMSDDFAGEFFSGIEVAINGWKELKKVISWSVAMGMDSGLLLPDICLARGLNYYTGCIFEVVSEEVAIGSIGGGGRYDDLTGIFGMPGLSGVGISFGLDRILEVIKESGKMDKILALKYPASVLVVNFGEEILEKLFSYIKLWREKNIPLEIYPEPGKLKKQMQYADRKKIPFVLMAGSDELEKGKFLLKNMHTGEQMMIDPDRLENYLEI